MNAWHLDGFSSGALSLPARINVVLEGHRQVKVCFRNLYQTSPTNQTWHLQPGMQAWRQKLKTSSHMHEDFFFNPTTLMQILVHGRLCGIHRAWLYRSDALEPFIAMGPRFSFWCISPICQQQKILLECRMTIILVCHGVCILTQ